MKKILFITGTRADYGKIKSLIKVVENHKDFEAYIYVSGMHLIEKFGDTYREVLKDHYKNVYVDFAQVNCGAMSYDFGNVVCNLTGYVSHIRPDLIVVHGDRIDALAGAIVGALNNIKVAHIEGGEISGTIDESIRHAITKFAHIHMVCNESARQRLIQLGETSKNIYIIGSPDIDVMLSDKLPSLPEAKDRYDIPFDTFALFMYHPVTTEFDSLPEKIAEVVTALIDSGRDYIVVYPNNDKGSEIILGEYNRLKGNLHFKIFPSLRFEYFLSFLKNAEFIIGNSSAGIRESGVYGIPAIDIGSRQTGRYRLEDTNIQHTDEEGAGILKAIGNIGRYRRKTMDYGQGDSTRRFFEILDISNLWELEIQKKFVDMHATI